MILAPVPPTGRAQFNDSCMTNSFRKCSRILFLCVVCDNVVVTFIGILRPKWFVYHSTRYFNCNGNGDAKINVDNHTPITGVYDSLLYYARLWRRVSADETVRRMTTEVRIASQRFESWTDRNNKHLQITSFNGDNWSYCMDNSET